MYLIVCIKENLTFLRTANDNSFFLGNNSIMPINLKSSDFTVVNGKPILNNNTVYQPSGKKLGQHSLKMVLVMKKTCFYCVKFAPTYSDIFNTIGKDLPVLQIESSDITPQLSQALDFKGYPTIKFFDKDGNMVGEYSGDRSKGDILNAICKMYHASFCPI